MTIKFEINMTNKWLYSLIVVGVLLALGVGVYTYQSNMRAGNPPVIGHSAGEINVENSVGEIVSLQDALDDFAGEIVSLQNALDLIGNSAEEISVEVDGNEMTLQSAIDNGRIITKCRVCIQLLSNSDIDGDKECSDYSYGGIERLTPLSGWAEANTGTYGGGKYSSRAWIECK